MNTNYTLEDFYEGKVAIYHNQNGIDENLSRILKWHVGGNFNYYTWNESDKTHIGYDDGFTLPSAPLSYFISLLDAQEAVQKAAKEPEYIYEPFSEEAAKNGATIVYEYAHGKYVDVTFIHYHKNICAILNKNDFLLTVNDFELKIRRTIEIKEVECYVYKSGAISSFKDLEYSQGKIIETFTHTIKIPTK